MNGFIVIERSIWGDPLFKKEPMSEREAWFWMVSQAAWQDTTHRVAGQIVTVPRGSFLTTLRELQHNMLWSSDKRVRGYLEMAERASLIGRTTVGPRNARKTLITICDYDKKQGLGRTEDAPPDAPGTHQGRTGDVVKEPLTREPLDGDDAGARADSTPVRLDGLEPREQVLLAMGLDTTGVTASGRIVGDMSDMLELRRWQDDLGLSMQAITNVIGEVMRRRSDQTPPTVFKYFTNAMQRHAADAARPKLTPIEGGRHDRQPSRNPTDARSQALGGLAESFQRVIAAQRPGGGSDDAGD